MAHYTTGLPKLDLEPFDPTALYAAANSPRRDTDRPGFRRSRRAFAVFGGVASVLAVVGAVLFYVLG